MKTQTIPEVTQIKQLEKLIKLEFKAINLLRITYLNNKRLFKQAETTTDPYKKEFFVNRFMNGNYIWEEQHKTLLEIQNEIKKISYIYN